ncbi:hypothetical protein O181_062593 [Austropuccinia psidii MF-1]|uniref:Uncharacterized protein n=1 Tax=Austropuccinia psidii MF-1 TaxID=1389203 RepID=A0A9Q3HZP5_9BASI|nr:hypothetical protein [Austropuccinia psidii MF-1]
MVHGEHGKISPTRSKTNGEQRRDDLMAHEEGTWANSEFTDPQITLSQSPLDQAKMRQQRKQAFKAHNVAIDVSKKGQKRGLKAELPDNFHEMRSGVYAHWLFLLKVKDKDFSSLPAPPRTEEHEIAIQVSGHFVYFTKDVFNEPSTQVQSKSFQRY